MIKAVLFDVDGVVLLPREKYFSERLADDYGVSPALVLPLFKNEFKDCLLGKADLKDILKKKYLKRWGWKGSIDELLHFWWKGEKAINKSVLSQIKRLRQKGIQCYLASDQEKYRADYLLNTLGLKNLLDGGFLSCKLGWRKTDKTFFEKILKELNLKPEEVVFWDDEEENVAVARQVGIDARLFALNSQSLNGRLS